jgi:ribosomal protein S18 acetylase RimI-like enzyme
MDEAIITEAIKEDAAGIVNVQRTGWITTYPNAKAGVTLEEIEQRFSDIDGRIQRQADRLGSNPEIQTWVAKSDDKVIAWCVASKSNNTALIDAIYVLPEYQGKGIGKKMMQIALEWLFSFSEIRLEVAIYNENAIRFYEKFGFKQSGAVDFTKHVFPSGAVIPVVTMIKN